MSSTLDVLVAPALAARQQRGRWLRGALIFVSAVLLVESLIGERGLARTLKAREDYQRASEGLAQLQAENAGLREQARRLQEDPATIEGVARKDLGLIRPGEILVVVKDVK
jgi:cell division protein FtsB